MWSPHTLSRNNGLQTNKELVQKYLDKHRDFEILPIGLNLDFLVLGFKLTIVDWQNLD